MNVTKVPKCNVWHFKFYRLLVWLEWFIHYPYHVIFHKAEYHGIGFIMCECDYVIDLGVSYGMHCESCYNRVSST